MTLVDFVSAAQAAEGTTAWNGDGAGGDATEVVPPITQAAPTELAWSAALDGRGEPERHSSREAWARAAPILFAAALVAVVVAVVGWIWIEHDKRQTSSAATPSTSLVKTNWSSPPTPVVASPAPSMPVLDGVYSGAHEELSHVSDMVIVLPPPSRDRPHCSIRSSIRSTPPNCVRAP
jgi:hypothetical protein